MTSIPVNVSSSSSFSSFSRSSKVLLKTNPSPLSPPCDFWSSSTSKNSSYFSSSSSLTNSLDSSPSFSPSPLSSIDSFGSFVLPVHSTSPPRLRSQPNSAQSSPKFRTKNISSGTAPSSPNEPIRPKHRKSCKIFVCPSDSFPGSAKSLKVKKKQKNIAKERKN